MDWIILLDGKRTDYEYISYIRNKLRWQIDSNNLQYKVNDGFQDSVIAANLNWEFSDREIDVTGGAHNFGLGLVGETPNPAHTITISNDGSTTLTLPS